MPNLSEDIADTIFRSTYVPLYPKDLPMSEMTPYEQGLYKQTFSIVSLILSLLRQRLPKKRKNIFDGTHLGEHNFDFVEGFNSAIEQMEKDLT